MIIRTELKNSFSKSNYMCYFLSIHCDINQLTIHLSGQDIKTIDKKKQTLS